MLKPFSRAVLAVIQSLILFLAFAAASLLLFWACFFAPMDLGYRITAGVIATIQGYIANWLWGQLDIDFWALSLYRD